MPEIDSIGVGPTEELSLRVSAAALARVVFAHPDSAVRMLALEHKASVARPPRPAEVTVKAQPFGGAVRLLNPDRFSSTVGNFNFDSQRSRSEGDFRVFVRPSSLGALQEFCLSHPEQAAATDLEMDPSRELAEEFEDTLGLQVEPGMHSMKRVGVVLENQPAPTSNVRAPGKLTARVYWIYEVEIKDLALRRALLASSRAHSAESLAQKALVAHERGKPGWANAALALALDQVREAYLALPPDQRGEPLLFHGTTLAGNVAAVLEGVYVPKFETRA